VKLEKIGAKKKLQFDFIFKKIILTQVERLGKIKFNVLIPAPPFPVWATTLFSISIGGWDFSNNI
jgi:hypothetical protein